MQRIYLDNNASAPLHPRVLAAIIEELSDLEGNPSSVHHHGQEARKRLTKARDVIAKFLGVLPNEIIFTSGSTESNNMVIRGIVGMESNGHIITSCVEHSSIAQTAGLMKNKGYDVTVLETDTWGIASPESVRAAIRPNTKLIALAAVNNETGVKLDVDAIAAIADQAKIPLLIDGVAWIGKELFTIPQGVSAMSFSGHKFHAPKGIGFTFIRQDLRLEPQITGGSHEYRRRAGTENVPGIIGMATAIQVLKDELPAAQGRMERLRNRLEEGIMSQLDGVTINGDGPRICNTSNVSFEGIEGESLLTGLDIEGVSVSHGSACSAGALEPSRVLMSMGIPKERAQSALRFSLSSMTTEEEIDRAIEIVVGLVNRLRDLVIMTE